MARAATIRQTVPGRRRTPYVSVDGPGGETLGGWS